MKLFWDLEEFLKRNFVTLYFLSNKQKIQVFALASLGLKFEGKQNYSDIKSLATNSKLWDNKKNLENSLKTAELQDFQFFLELLLNLASKGNIKSEIRP